MKWLLSRFFMKKYMEKKQEVWYNMEYAWKSHERSGTIWTSLKRLPYPFPN